MYCPWTALWHILYGFVVRVSCVSVHVCVLLCGYMCATESILFGVYCVVCGICVQCEVDMCICGIGCILKV